MNKLLSITHVRGVFLDISKAFDKVWHKGLKYKLKQSGISGNLLDTITDFLNSRKQRVTLNGQFSSWTSTGALVPQGSILGPLLFLIYINDLFDDLITNIKLYADDTFLFSEVHDVNISGNNLMTGQHNGKWVLILIQVNKLKKYIFQETAVLNRHHNSIYFNHNLVLQVPSQKHLDNITSKADKSIRLLRKLQAVLLRPSLVTIYKAFIKLHLGYGILYMIKHTKNHFIKKLEPIQYNATLSITGAIRGTSREKLYQELGLESLQKRRWYRKLCYLFKILKGQSPDYLSKILPSIRRAYNTRNVDYISCFDTKNIGIPFSHQL